MTKSKENEALADSITISEAKLKNRGNKGIQVKYNSIDQMELNGKAQSVKTPTEKNFGVPISMKMRQLSERMRYHLLVRMGHDPQKILAVYDKDENCIPSKVEKVEFQKLDRDKKHYMDLLNRTEVIRFKMNGSDVMVEGKIQSKDGNKKDTIKTSMMDSDDYEEYDDLVDLITEFFDESRYYVAGKIDPDIKQLVMDLEMDKKDEKEAKEAVGSMSQEQMHDYVINDLQEKGHLIIGPDDIPGVESDEEEKEQDGSMDMGTEAEHSDPEKKEPVKKMQPVSEEEAYLPKEGESIEANGTNGASDGGF